MPSRALAAMDSVTQAVLGAAVGEAVLGKKLGYKAALWGAFWGTVPDLDVLAYPFLDEMQRLYWHRGLSHSFLACLLCIPIIAWILQKIHQEKISWRRASAFAFLVWFTHILIDYFTIYGTGIFEPFNGARYGSGNFFIIDPLFTIPLLIGLIISLFQNKDKPARFWINSSGLILASIYTMWSFSAKHTVNTLFADHFANKNIERWFSAPTPLNTFYWRAVAQTDGGYYIAYVHVADDSDEVRSTFIPHGHKLVSTLQNSTALEALEWFSMGYWIARKKNEELILTDLRFGDNWLGRTGQESEVEKQIWNYTLSNDNTTLIMSEREVEIDENTFRDLWNLIRNKKEVSN